MERAISIIKDFNLNKDQIEQFASQVLNDVFYHDGDILSTAICLRAMEDVIKKIRSGVGELITEEAEKYDEKTFEYKGAKFTKTNRATYVYSESSEWNKLNEKKKELESLMKTIKEPVADPETGELIYPAQKKVSESVSITIK